MPIKSLIAAAQASSVGTHLPPKALADLKLVLAYNDRAHKHQRVPCAAVAKMLRDDHGVVMSEPTLFRYCKAQLGRTFGGKR
jgi:hypothetical protein